MGGNGKQHAQVLAQEQKPYIEEDALPPSAQTAWDTAVKPSGLWIRSLHRGQHPQQWGSQDFLAGY